MSTSIVDAGPPGVPPDAARTPARPNIETQTYSSMHAALVALACEGEAVLCDRDGLYWSPMGLLFAHGQEWASRAARLTTWTVEALSQASGVLGGLGLAGDEEGGDGELFTLLRADRLAEGVVVR